mgnify:CR=1 FL=1
MSRVFPNQKESIEVLPRTKLHRFYGFIRLSGYAGTFLHVVNYWFVGGPPQFVVQGVHFSPQFSAYIDDSSGIILYDFVQLLLRLPLHLLHPLTQLGQCHLILAVIRGRA